MFLATPVIRTVARIDMPSVRHPTMRVRCSVLSRFTILTIMLDRLGKSQLERAILCQNLRDPVRLDTIVNSAAL